MSAPRQAAAAPEPRQAPAARAGSWRFLWQSALKDIKRQIRDPLAVAMWIGIPVAIATLIFAAFGGTDAPPRAHLLVVDQDGSAVSQLFLGALNRVPVFDVETEKVSSECVAESAGVLRRQVAPRGATLPVGALVGVLADADVDEAEVDRFVAGFAPERQV